MGPQSMEGIGLFLRSFDFNTMHTLVRAGLLFLFPTGDFSFLASLFMIIAMSLILLLSGVRHASAFHAFALLLFVYHLGSAVLHPWYLIVLIGFSPFLGKWGVMVQIGSYLALWSYIGYEIDAYSHPYWLLAIAYGVVISLCVWEGLRKPLYAIFPYE